MKFELTEKQIKKRDEWCEALKTVFGEVGIIEYRFTPTGIGNGLVLYSRLAKKELDITDVDNW